MSQSGAMDPAIDRERRDRRRRETQLRGRLLAVLLVAAIAGYGLFLATTGPDTSVRDEFTEGLALATEAQSAVAAYIARHMDYPIDNAAVGLPSPAEISNRSVASITVDRGFVVIRFGNGSRLAGKAVTLIPDATEYGGVRWACDAPGIANRDLPAACRLAN